MRDEERVGERDGGLVVDRNGFEDKGYAFAANELSSSFGTSELTTEGLHPVNATGLEEAHWGGGTMGERRSRKDEEDNYYETKQYIP